MTKRLILLSAMLGALLSFTSSANAALGSEGGGGGGVLARLLVNAQGYLLEELPRVSQEKALKDQLSLRETYLRIREVLLRDIKAIEFQQVSETTVLTDPHFGYKTWIRILPGSPVRIEYNPSPELYKQLVQNQMQGGGQESAPQLRDVVGFLLHELGHHYGLSEEQSWRFAFGLQKEFEANPRVADKSCELSYWGKKMVGPKKFILTATGEFLEEAADGNNFSIRHVYFKEIPPQIYFTAWGTSLKLAIQADANSILDFAQEAVGDLKFLRVRCVPKGSPLDSL